MFLVVQVVVFKACWTQKSYKKYRQWWWRSFESSQLFVTSCPKMVGYSHYTYCLQNQQYSSKFILKISRYFHYISFLQAGSTYFGLKVSGHSGLRVSGDFGPKNYTRNIQKYFLSFSNFSWIFFYAKLSRNTILRNTQTNYHLTYPILCHYPPQRIYFWLSLY